MKFETWRWHNNIRFYGYRFASEPTKLYWSMRFYQEIWHVPMVVIE
jgi:hypothetical protein